MSTRREQATSRVAAIHSCKRSLSSRTAANRLHDRAFAWRACRRFVARAQSERRLIVVASRDTRRLNSEVG